MQRGVIEVMVDAVNEVQRAAVFDWGRNNHLARARRKVGRDFGLGLEHTRGVDHQINAHRGQWQILDPLHVGQPHTLPFNRQTIRTMRDRTRPAAMDGIEFHQQSMLIRGTRGIVDQYNLAPCTGVDQVAQGEFADPAKAVKSDACHAEILLGDQVLALSPRRSTCDCSATRLSVSNGKAAKAVMRRRRSA